MHIGAAFLARSGEEAVTDDDYEHGRAFWMPL